MPKTRDRTMGINVSTSMGFENQNFLRSTAKQILQRGGASKEKSESILKSQGDYFVRPSADINSLSSQITLNSSLKETLKYLSAHAADKRKPHVLGELWDKFNEQNEPYQGELVDFEIDYSLENIFAA